MRRRYLFAFASFLLAPIVAFGAWLFRSMSWRGDGRHYHLLPSTPRSILETRRMGLA